MESMQRAAKEKSFILWIVASVALFCVPSFASSIDVEHGKNRVEIFLLEAQNGTGQQAFDTANRVENYDSLRGVASESSVAPKTGLPILNPNFVPRVMTKGERLGLFSRRLLDAPGASNADDAFKLLGRTMDDVEDAFSGVARARNPGLKYDGRMYPPRADFTTRLPNGGLEAITKGNVVRIGPDGSIRLYLRNADGSLGAQVLEKLGAGL